MRREPFPWPLCVVAIVLIFAMLYCFFSYFCKEVTEIKQSLQYHGHTYVVLKCGYQSQTVIHDPDCPKCLGK